MPDPLTGCKAIFQNYQEAVSKLQRGKASPATAWHPHSWREHRPLGLTWCWLCARPWRCSGGCSVRIQRQTLRCACSLPRWWAWYSAQLHPRSEREEVLSCWEGVALDCWCVQTTPPVPGLHGASCQGEHHAYGMSAGLVMLTPAQWATYYNSSTAQMRKTEVQRWSPMKLRIQTSNRGQVPKPVPWSTTLPPPGILLRPQDKYPQLLTEWKGTVFGKYFHLGIWTTVPSTQKAT